MILYRIIVNITHVFRAFNSRTGQAVRKYFNNKNLIFAIYGINQGSILEKVEENN